MGIVLDKGKDTFMLFDSNEGVATFYRPEHLREWLWKIYTEYDDDWTGYYMDTWKR